MVFEIDIKLYVLVGVGINLFWTNNSLETSIKIYGYFKFEFLLVLHEANSYFE